MTKKVVALMLTAAMVIGLSACGNSEKEVSEEKFWKSKEVTIPMMSNFSVREETLFDAGTIKLVTTPFQLDVNTVMENLKVNKFISDRYDLYLEKKESMSNFESYNEGDFHDYSYSDIIRGTSKTEDASIDFSVTLRTDYAFYENINSITVSFENLTQTSQIQNEVVKVLEIIYGKEIAEYLAYSEPTNDSPGADHMFDCDMWLQSEDGSDYLFERNLSKDDGVWAASFMASAYLPENDQFGAFVYYDGGKELMFNNAKYSISKITEGGLSDADFDNFSKMFPEYTSINVGGEFVRNDINSFNYYEGILPNGDAEYSMSIYELSTNLLDVSAYQQPNISISYHIKENEDGMNYLDVSFRGESIYAHIESFDKEDLLNSMKEQASVLMPYIDLSSIVYSADENSYSVRGVTSYLGTECDFYVSFSVSDNDGHWSANINLANY